MVTFVVHAWCLLVIWTNASYIPVWRSEATLWAHAVQVAPLKPRPAVNFGKALILQGNIDAGERWLTRALALGGQPHIPSYDRSDVVTAVQGNLQTIAIMRAVYGL